MLLQDLAGNHQTRRCFYHQGTLQDLLDHKFLSSQKTIWDNMSQAIRPDKCFAYQAFVLHFSGDGGQPAVMGRL